MADIEKTVMAESVANCTAWAPAPFATVPIGEMLATKIREVMAAWRDPKNLRDERLVAKVAGVKPVQALGVLAAMDRKITEAAAPKVIEEG